MGTDDLAGESVLLVEDDVLIRHDLEAALSGYGASVTATGRLDEAMRLADGAFGHAVLDVKLEDGGVQPVARRLAERGVPFVFHSSAARCEGLAAAFPDAPVVPKPALPHKLAAIIAGARPAVRS